MLYVNLYQFFWENVGNFGDRLVNDWKYWVIDCRLQGKWSESCIVDNEQCWKLMEMKFSSITLNSQYFHNISEPIIRDSNLLPGSERIRIYYSKCSTSFGIYNWNSDHFIIYCPVISNIVYYPGYRFRKMLKMFGNKFEYVRIRGNSKMLGKRWEFWVIDSKMLEILGYRFGNVGKMLGILFSQLLLFF